MRLPALTTAFLAPLCARAFVDFTNNAFTGIAVGQAFNLTWQGDGTVGFPCHFLTSPVIH